MGLPSTCTLRMSLRNCIYHKTWSVAYTNKYLTTCRTIAETAINALRKKPRCFLVLWWTCLTSGEFSEIGVKLQVDCRQTMRRYAAMVTLGPHVRHFLLVFRTRLVEMAMLSVLMRWDKTSDVGGFASLVCDKSLRGRSTLPYLVIYHDRVLHRSPQSSSLSEDRTRSNRAAKR